MIPNVFVSSTIADLQYLREALRQAIQEIGYNPIMSERDGVGYISPSSAADACFVALKQCQFAVLIIGKRYGSKSDSGHSITHKEFLTAKENDVPLITFVDSDVMAYKKVYDVDPDASTWDSIPDMDAPRDTFALIDEVRSAPTYNGMIDFKNASDVAGSLKAQIAHYVGDRLSGAVKPLKSDVHEILAEVKTLRNMLSHPKTGDDQDTVTSAKFYTAMRFLLDERREDYTRFVEAVFGDIDVAIPKIIEAKNFDELSDAAPHEFTVVEDKAELDQMEKGTSTDPSKPSIRQWSSGRYGSWGIDTAGRAYVSSDIRDRLDSLQQNLHAKLNPPTGS